MTFWAVLYAMEADAVMPAAQSGAYLIMKREDDMHPCRRVFDAWRRHINGEAVPVFPSLSDAWGVRGRKRNTAVGCAGQAVFATAAQMGWVIVR